MKYKEKIKSIGVTIEFVSKSIGVNRPALSNYLNGFREMPADVETKLINFLKRYPNA